LDEFNALRPNNLLKHRLIEILKDRQYRSYCLGGGKKVDDGIYTYKKTFSKDGSVDFCIATKVHHSSLYEDCCRLWEAQFPEGKERYRHILLKYKMGMKGKS
jgi:hypothetical protein